MMDIGDEFEMHSNDYSEKFYRDKKLDSGYLGKIALGYFEKGRFTHKFHLGGVACSFMEKIGDGIDCLILDTIHLAPGEIIEFLTLLPYLKDGCVVILHDTIFSHICRYKDKYRYATSLLLSSVSGQKYINIDPGRKAGLPNIAAFMVDKETRDRISDVFLSLVVPWNFMPYGVQLKEYKKCIYENYSSDLIDIYESAVSLNRGTYYVKSKEYSFPFEKIRDNSQIILYGAGKVGHAFVEQIKRRNDLKLLKWVDKRADELNLSSVEMPDSILKVEHYDYIIIAIDDANAVAQVKEYLTNLGVFVDKIIWRKPKQI